jgi:hypothetical protein
MKPFKNLSGKTLVKYKNLHIYCDGGEPKNFKIPRFYLENNYLYKGVVMTWLSRQFFFTWSK